MIFETLHGTSIDSAKAKEVDIRMTNERLMFSHDKTEPATVYTVVIRMHDGIEHDISEHSSPAEAFAVALEFAGLRV